MGLDSSVDQHGATYCIIDLTYDTSEVIKPLESYTPQRCIDPLERTRH